MAKGREILFAIRQRQKDIYPRKLYRNSECDVCEDYLNEVRLFGNSIMCKKCYQKQKEKR